MTIAAVSVGMLATDFGRSLLLNGISNLLPEVTVKIKGLHGNQIREISIRLLDGMELQLQDLILDECWDRATIRISKLSAKVPTSGGFDGSKLKAIIPWMRNVRFCLKDLSLQSGIIRRGDKTYLLDDFIYNSRKDRDSCSAKISLSSGDKHCLGVLLNWKNEECMGCDVEYVQDNFPCRGSLKIKYPERQVAKYSFGFQNDRISVLSSGNYQNFLFDIEISTATLIYKNFTDDSKAQPTEITCSGHLYLTKREAFIETKVILERLPYFHSLSEMVVKNFRRVQANLGIICDFDDEVKGRANVIFKRDDAHIGDAVCHYESGRAHIDGNIDWVSVAGFDFSNFHCDVDENKHANIILFGRGFEIASTIAMAGSFLVKKLELKSPKGFLRSLKPFSNLDDLRCEFNFSQLDFFQKILPLAGAGSGNLEYKNKKIVACGNFPQLIFNNQEIKSLNFSVDGDNFSTTIKKAKILGIRLKNIDAKSSNGQLKLTALVNGNGRLKASGIIDKSLQKISLDEGQITLPKGKIKVSQCVVDIGNTDYQVRCEILDGKKPGEAKIICDNRKIVCNFSSFPLDNFLLLFNHRFFSCRLNGNLSLKSENDIFVGDGDLSLANLTAHGRNLQVHVKIDRNGTKISANQKNGKDFIDITAFLPILIKNDMRILKIKNNLLDCLVKIDTHLERMLELPDNADLRGHVLCDFHLDGTFDNPVISGKGAMQNAYIAIGSVLLCNGDISLIGSGNSLEVLKGEFIDHKKKKAIVRGNGRVFFDGIIPNINTNLQLKFDDFSLLYSDGLKVDILGEGTMSGPINNMILRGKVTVPRCEIEDFTTEDEWLNIKIENDPYFSKKKSNDERKDFFQYEISMHCQNIKFVGNIFEMHLLGDMSLLTHQDRGTLVGDLLLSSGRVDLFGRRMKVVHGKVSFLREFPYNPEAAFKCQRNFGDVSVGLDINNSPTSGVSFNLYSNPSYTQDIILSKMLFGKESKYLTLGEAAELAHAVASLNRGGYIFSVLNTFQKIGVVDSISFAGSENKSNSLYSNTQSSSTQNNMNMSAGKYIHDNVYISVNKKGNESSFDVDFSLTPSISLKTNTKGEAGISWKYRY
jgi:hypothetical protein